VALGIGIDGVKHPLALVEGSTENATLVPTSIGRVTSRPRPRRSTSRSVTSWLRQTVRAVVPTVPPATVVFA